jgi:hypothetical protein
MINTAARSVRLLPFLFLAWTLADPAFAASAVSPSKDDLLAGFTQPPPAAKPRVWWHWMNGNVTKDGIKKDLDWMKRIGIGGVDAIDASLDTPQVVDKRLAYMTPEWKDAFTYAVKLADQYGMEFSIDSSPGWSESGGPWVTPQQAMKKAVWSTTVLEGGKAFHGTLPKPPGNPGPIQNALYLGDPTPLPKTAAVRFYRDAVVIAYKQPVAGAVVEEATSNGGKIDVAALSDDDLAGGMTLKAPTQSSDVWVRVKYEHKARIQGWSLGLIASRFLGYTASLEASDDGDTWRHVADMPPGAFSSRMLFVQQTISFAPVTARYFRVVLKPAKPIPLSSRPLSASAPGYDAAADTPPEPPRSYKLVQLQLRAEATVHEFERKALYASPMGDFYDMATTSNFVPGSAVDPASVVVLTDKMKPDGTLDWTPPPGKWTVLRIGYSLTGAENHPATEEATGLEVDKLNAGHVRSYMEKYLDSYEAVTGKEMFGKHGINSVQVDSNEAGQQNWTEDILSEFKRLRGYDPAPFLPVLTGVAVQSPAASDKFLWDFRHTINDLYDRNHYGVIAQVVRERGLFSYAESLQSYRPAFDDGVVNRQFSEIPMGELWTYNKKYTKEYEFGNEADIMGAASLAHVYGMNLVAAESLTSGEQPWNFAPRDLKMFLDKELLRGVNRIVLHTSVHQPIDKAPGMSLGRYGQFFTRHESWAEEAKPWVSYMARASYLLQQGRFAADIAYFYGQEAAPARVWGRKRVSDVPPGYVFDFVDIDALLHQMSVENGVIVTKSGMRYGVLYLGGSSNIMTLAALNRITEMVREGAVLVGKPPEASPSLADDDVKFRAAVQDLFGDGTVHSYGKGRVFPSGSLSEALAAISLPPDFAYSGDDAKLLYLHRHLKDGEIYFVSNREDKAVNTEATFRVTGKLPEIWDAVSGKTAPAAYRIENGHTTVAVSLPSYGSAFVVFRKPAKAMSVTLHKPVETAVETIDGPWTVAFQPDRGAPPKVVLNTLTSWSDNADPGVKYFSGAGTYQKTFTMPGKRKGVHYVLDLGEVHELADVTLNGKNLGTVWTKPFRLDITKAVKPGRNVLHVKVFNLWVNRLIGDKQPGVTKKYTFTLIPTYKPDAPLRESGLKGPVSILRVN